MERFEKIIKLIAELNGKQNWRHNSDVDFYGNIESDVACLGRSLN
jgi:hypothetical protein